MCHWQSWKWDPEFLGKPFEDPELKFISMLLKFIDGTGLEESGQSIENIDWTHLVLASGKRVLLKDPSLTCKISRWASLSALRSFCRSTSSVVPTMKMTATGNSSDTEAQVFRIESRRASPTKVPHVSKLVLFFKKYFGYHKTIAMRHYSTAALWHFSNQECFK